MWQAGGYFCTVCSTCPWVREAEPAVAIPGSLGTNKTREKQIHREQRSPLSPSAVHFLMYVNMEQLQSSPKRGHDKWQMKSRLRHKGKGSPQMCYSNSSISRCRVLKSLGGMFQEQSLSPIIVSYRSGVALRFPHFK